MASSRTGENLGAHHNPNASKFDIRSLLEQARKGSWRALLEIIKEARKLGASLAPDQRLVYTTFHILALVKLGNYPGAAEELAALGDFASSSFSYEHYPDLFPDRSGSMIPFALRWLHAALPYRLGQTPTSMERMYSLLDHCTAKELAAAESQAELQDPEVAGDHPSSLVERWRRRREVVTFGIINLHLGQRDFVVALRFLDKALAREPESVELWSRFAHVQLQLGDVNGAKLTFARVEELVEKRVSSDEVAGGESLRWLVGRNKGVEAFVEKEYGAAVKAFNSVLEMNPEDAIAANNKALSLMYSRDLIRGTQVLEDVLQKHTVAALNETLVLNLCSMYELAAVNSNESKRKMSSWILQVAPDDFDLTCTRL